MMLDRSRLSYLTIFRPGLFGIIKDGCHGNITHKKYITSFGEY